MHDVFISYARGDRARVKGLADGLVAARGWAVWWDPKLRAGEPFPHRIQEALAGSRCVVVVWSTRSVVSDWVVAEATEGWERGILVPVRVDDCTPPLPFRQTQAVDLTRWPGSTADGAFLELLEGIQRVLGQGEAIDAGELQARERRRRTHQRRVIARRLAVAGAIVVAALAAGLTARTYVARRDVVRGAEMLAGHADRVLREITTLTHEEEKRRWWSLLRGPRLDRLELSVLLAAEAVSRARTERTEWALRDALALLPWSDWHLVIDFDNAPCALDFTRDGRLLVAGGGRGDTIVVRPGGSDVTARIPHGGTGGQRYWQDRRGRFFGIRGSCHVLDVSPAADIVATAGPDETAALWDAPTGRELRRLGHDAVVTAAAFDTAGARIATATERGTVALWDVASGRQVHAMRHGDAVYWVGFSPSARSVASASLDGTVRVWRPDTGREPLPLVHDGAVEGARFSPDERVVATFGPRIATRLWNAETGVEIWRLPDDTASVAGVVFDAQGRIMVVGRTDGHITWWDVAQRAPLFSVSEDSVYVRRMAPTPDRRFLVSIAADDEARVWDFATGRLLKRLPYGGVGSGGHLHGVAVTPDGRRFATAGVDPGSLEMAIEVTEIWPSDPVAAACAKVKRSLTQEEWRRYVGAEAYRPTCAPAADQGHTMPQFGNGSRPRAIVIGESFSTR